MKITESILVDLQEEPVTRLDSQCLTHHLGKDARQKPLFEVYRLSLVLRRTSNLVRHAGALLLVWQQPRVVQACGKSSALST